jgi:hypothetical protein
MRKTPSSACWTIWSPIKYGVPGTHAKGADVNAKMPPYDERPLHKAIESRRADVVKVLIAHGADINAMTQDGHTPMDTANTVYGRDPSLFEIVNLAGGKEGKVLRREQRP